MTIVVHSSPGCVQCTSTERHADRKDIDIEVVHLDEHPDILDQIKERGITAAPFVVVIDENGVEIDNWTGFQPQKLNEYGAKQRELALA